MSDTDKAPTKGLIERVLHNEQMQGDGLVELQQDIVAEIEWLRKRVLELKRPPRGIGGQVVTVADGCPTYGDLLGAYYRTENEYVDHFAKLWQRIKEQDAEIDRLKDLVDSGSSPEADR